MHDYSREDAAMRSRLERNSSAGERANIVGTVNKLAAGHAERELPGLTAIGLMRLLQKGHTSEVRGLNSRHDAWLRKARQEPDLAGGDPPYRERFTPSLRAERVRDAEGRMRGGMSTEDGRGDSSDHWPSGKVEDAMQVLSPEDLRHVLSMRIRQRFF